MMIPIKIQCGCGQRYSFEIEPVNGRMPTTVACPVCGVDGPANANAIIQQSLSTQAPAPSAAPAGPRLRTAAPAAPALRTAAPAAPAPAPAASATISSAAALR